MPRLNRSTLSAVSVALAMCAAATATAGCGRTDTKPAPAAAPHEAPVSAARTPEPSLSASPQGKESASPKGSEQSSAPPASQSPGGKAAQGERSAARTAAVLPEGLAKLPVEKALGWKPDGPLTSQELRGQKITLNECANVAGATLWQQQGYLSSAKNAAGQQLFFFPDASSAGSAYDQLVADMNTCQATSRQLQAREGAPQDAVVSTTATVKDGTAWSRHWTGVGGMSARDVQTNHLYVVRQGDHLTLFQFDELAERPGPPHDTGTDAAVLDVLAGLGAQN
ncbi:hypothetical protein ACFZBM_27740 [Streptomyces lavendulae]|uniref:Uncharacterized protein n=1 Tax=Streptomyces lavendulae subsp. lavendulae TaxID=58340 RepID=A0A2K8PA03_STRLA|nr:hypothetical protein [Streptomyces lavendulae]ATZ23567.1 hypothetical protein SLAV_08480 [Streptomyces lavendulae subsp. lavendulae]QUQ53398.1 hypothetical protein SLLC_06510 [Streptomyces lavendulae subsp. lavendulae]